MALPSLLSQEIPPVVVVEEQSEDPVIVGGSPSRPTAQDAEPGSVTTNTDDQKTLEKFFIVKSLTVQDLESSVRNGTWATQSHNEDALNSAYQQAENVYLVFSANKSGEYFGYARMASPISGELVPVNALSFDEPAPSPSSGTPQSIPTPATDTAPKGRIIDDSARGTIFWEAELSDDEGSQSPEKDVEGSARDEQWGRQFKIEWISTSRLPFYRTRGLRNPWNANREVKIARDGTEIEPNIGRRLLQMFHRAPASPHDAMSPGHPGMLYR